MCCQGCRAAAEWIEQLGLADYYRLRTTPARKPDSAGSSTHDSWQSADNARHVVRNLGGDLRETLLLIEGVRCTACVWLIERALGGMPGVVSVQINAMARRARVIWQDSKNTLPQLLHTLSRTGYEGLPLDARGLDDLRRRESRDALKRLLVAGFGAMQAMMYATAIYLGAAESLDASTRELLRWLGLLVATPVVLYSARPFFAGALRSLRARRVGMDVPVAMAIAAVYAASVVEALRGSGEVYFDSISMFVFFLLTGRYLEMRARHRAHDLTDALAKTHAAVCRSSARGWNVATGRHPGAARGRLRARRRRRHRTGRWRAADASAAVWTRRCSAASPHRWRNVAATCSSQAACSRMGRCWCASSALGADTALAGIAALVGRAHTERPRLQVAGELAAARFVGRVLALTALTAAAWAFFDPARAFPAAVAVLVISCPCAFALAVPAAITRALSTLARRGVLVVKPDALQALAECTHAMFDKTGTLTETTLSLADVQTFDGISRHEALRRPRHSRARAVIRPRARSPPHIPALMTSQRTSGDRTPGWV